MLIIIGPMPISKGYRYCLTIIDRFTRWPEGIPLPDISTNTVATVIFTKLDGKIRHSTPHHDRSSRQFEAELFKRLMQLTNSTHLRTTAYHLSTNGLVERFHRQLKTAIKCHQTENWIEILPVILMGIRLAWREDLQAAEMVYGEPITLPGQFLQKLQKFLKRTREKY